MSNYISTFMVFCFFSVLWLGQAMAAGDDPTEVRLGGIEVTESKDTINHITQIDIERKTAVTLWDAMQGVLGVYQQTSSGCNEGTISIRGSNRYQVGMYIADIPVATAYRNEWDANNAMLWDMESIEVSKGYSSPLLTSNNNLAGVINLRTAKPIIRNRDVTFSSVSAASIKLVPIKS